MALGGFVELDAVVLDRSGLELFGDALADIAGGLANLEEAVVGGVGDGVGVDAGAGIGLGLQELNTGGPTHR